MHTSLSVYHHSLSENAAKLYNLQEGVPPSYLRWTLCLPLQCQGDFIDIAIDTVTEIVEKIIDEYHLNYTIPDIPGIIIDFHNWCKVHPII